LRIKQDPPALRVNVKHKGVKKNFDYETQMCARSFAKREKEKQADAVSGARLLRGRLLTA
jgi:hypothetical protein